MYAHRDKENEVIVGLQADAPLAMVLSSKGGIHMGVGNGSLRLSFRPDDEKSSRSTVRHITGVYCTAPPVAYANGCRVSSAIITDLPMRIMGRIIGDYLVVSCCTR